MDISNLRASNGSGEAIRAIVQSPARASGATIIKVNAVTNWPQKFVATSGTLLSNGTLDPSTVFVFAGHLSGGDIIVDTAAPGYPDPGNTPGQVVVIKPTTAWADIMQESMTTLQGQMNNQLAGYNTITGAVSVVQQNGNRSTDISIVGDQRSLLSKGIRLRIPRTVTPQTQSFNLNGTTQYLNKTSPAGMTFTDDFVCGAWVKLNSYTGGAIITRYNGTSGWILRTDVNGAVALYGYNGSSSNASLVGSAQSLPLNKWVHITAQLDMSAFTSTVGAEGVRSWIMFDGVEVPTVVSRSGTNPTSLIQAGNLEVGSFNGGAAPFNGYIAQPFVTSAKVTQANVRSFMNAGITPAVISANNIISAFSGNGTLNDLNTTNANNLTAQGGAGYITDAPFNANAYAIIMSDPVFGGSNTTMNVQTANGYSIPNETLGTVSYSSSKVPFGFPSDASKWRVQANYNATIATVGMGAGTFAPLVGIAFSLPIGAGRLGYSVSFQQTPVSGGDLKASIGFSTSATSITIPDSASYLRAAASGISVLSIQATNEVFVDNSTSISYGMTSRNGTAVAATSQITPANEVPSVLYWDNALL